MPASLAAVLRATGEGAKSDYELSQLRQQQEQKLQERDVQLQQMQQQQDLHQQHQQLQQQQQQQQQQRKVGTASRPADFNFGGEANTAFDAYFDKPPPFGTPGAPPRSTVGGFGPAGMDRGFGRGPDALDSSVPRQDFRSQVQEKAGCVAIMRNVYYKRVFSSSGI